MRPMRSNASPHKRGGPIGTIKRAVTFRIDVPALWMQEVNMPAAPPTFFSTPGLADGGEPCPANKGADRNIAGPPLGGAHGTKNNLHWLTSEESNMRFVLFTIIVALCISTVLSQMTFSDHWSKRGEAFPRFKPKESEPSLSQQFCQEEKVTEVLSQLTRLNDVQNTLTGYLNTCYQRRV
ncbi:hypothetical protein GCK32_017273 [Trichostrongylus colubriformis]|uniref:Uncharacterized protein n=1 Tax=Trichostrongylus colubriformis TaxID=6319 RepID=A0AAN8EYB1_TRICO